MEGKYKAIRARLKKHIEDSNGEGSWNEYYGSQLEADIVRFVENDIKNSVVLADVSKQRELLIAYETWKVENDIKNLLPDQLADFYIDESNL